MTGMARIREISLMEMKPDIENMTLNEYLKYEAEKERIGAENMKRIGQDIVQDNDLEEDQRMMEMIGILLISPTTKPVLDELLEDKILNVAMVDEEADPIRDIEEPERLLVEDPHFTEIQVHSVITKPEPFIDTQPMSPLYGIFESYKSSTKPYKVDREMKSLSKYGLKSSFPYPIANDYPN
ncbi:hypothetical protein Tco_1266678 [Tanacetum coccineum]